MILYKFYFLKFITCDCIDIRFCFKFFKFVIKAVLVYMVQTMKASGYMVKMLL